MLCDAHSKKAPIHGLVTGAIPRAKWKSFKITEAEVAALQRGESRPELAEPVHRVAAVTSSSSSRPSVPPRESVIAGPHASTSAASIGSLLKRRRASGRVGLDETDPPSVASAEASGVRVIDGVVVREPRPVAAPRSGRVVSLQSDDVNADRARLDAEQLARAIHRRDHGERGRITDRTGEDIDRSAGGPWSAGR